MVETIMLDGGPFSIAALSAGAGPLMVLAHGFPDTPRSFHHQLDYFSSRGYRVVAPWLRGYAPTGPAVDNNYTAPALGQDLIAVIDALGYAEAIVVGHDWGAGAGYSAAIMAPERISHLVTCAVPYGPVMMNALADNGDQQRRSWYLFFFQTPFAEQAVAHNDFALIKRLWQEWAGPDWQGDEHVLAAVFDCFRQHGTVAAALQYYRQVFAAPPPDQYLPITVPTLYIHGEEDGCIGVELAEPDQCLFQAGCDYAQVAGAGHFVHLEKPGEFNQRVAEFIAG
ncbi:MAG: alpha/beta hydrolase [Gammaproteobacteria bacterium]